MVNKWIPKIARWLLGLMSLVFGIMAFTMKEMPAMEGVAGQFTQALFASGYIFLLQGIVLTLVGIALLFNRFVSLALILLAPFTLNWLLFHLLISWPNWMPSVVMVVLQVYLAHVNWKSYAHLFKAK